MAKKARVPTCEFCGATLEDTMIAFLDHLDASPTCKMNWEQWRQNLRREMGGT